MQLHQRPLLQVMRNSIQGNFSYHDSSVVAAAPGVSNVIAASNKVDLRKLRTYEWDQISNIADIKVNLTGRVKNDHL
jgi:hypothetical protein